MKKIFTILTIIFISSIVFAEPLKSPLNILLKTFKNGELVKIPSYNAPLYPNTFLEIKDGSYKNSPIEIDALITYPKKGKSPFPLVVFTHSSGGPKQFNNQWFKFDKQMAKLLLKKGIAVMFLDNYSVRGVKDTHKDQSTVSNFSGYIDAFMALDYLSSDKKIDIKKVGITGWSRGGMNSTYISEKRMRDILISKDLYYAAALPRSVDCESGGFFFMNPLPVKETKTLMVNGEIDDVTPAAPCIEYGKRLKANGANIEVITKKGWGHGFTANYEPSYERDSQVFTDCPPWYLRDDGTFNPESNYLWDDPCIGLGNTIGGNKGSLFKKTFLKFFETNLLN